MRKQIFLTIILFVGAVHAMAATDYNALWQKGNSAYKQKQYDSAAIYYEQIAALKPKNAEVYYNLGNTYYRLNRVAPAVLNYERALQIDPDHKLAKDNLTLTHSRISNYIPEAGDIFFVNWWQALTAANKTTRWAVAALLTFVLTIGLVLLRRYPKAVGKVPVQLPGFMGFVCACFLLLAFAAAGHSTEATAAVVMQNDAPLMNNELRGKALALVPEGTTVKIKSEKAGWAEVRLPDGRTGWLQLDVLTRI